MWLATMSPRLVRGDGRRDAGSRGLAAASGAGLQSRAGGTGSTGTPLKILFLGQEPGPASGRRRLPGAGRAARAPRHSAHAGADAGGAGGPARLLRRGDAYGNHATLTPEQEKALARLRRGRQGARRDPLPRRACSGASERVRRARRRPVASATAAASSRAEIVAADASGHEGLAGRSTTWDETLRATRSTTRRPHGADGARRRGRGASRDTWVRTQGKGRVFYTAYGHDQRTWDNPGFQTLIEQAIVWAVDEPARARRGQQLKMPEIVYVDGFTVPNYEKRDPGAEVSAAVRRRDESMKFIQVPAEFTLELFASEPDIVKPIAFSFDERGRLWVIETMDYPNEVLNGEPGRRPDQDPRGHQRRRPRGQVHGVRRSPQHPDEPRVRQRRRHRDAAAAHPVPEGHERRRQGGRPRRC